MTKQLPVNSAWLILLSMFRDQISYTYTDKPDVPHLYQAGNYALIALI